MELTIVRRRFRQLRAAFRDHQFVARNIPRSVVNCQFKPLRQQLLQHHLKLLFGCPRRHGRRYVVFVRLHRVGHPRMARNLVRLNSKGLLQQFGQCHSSKPNPSRIRGPGAGHA